MGNKPSGFNWHSTGEQVARNVDLSGKNVIVTGGNTGTLIIYILKNNTNKS